MIQIKIFYALAIVSVFNWWFYCWALHIWHENSHYVFRLQMDTSEEDIESTGNVERIALTPEDMKLQ